MPKPPFWLDRFPKSRRPSFPTYRGESTADVVIIGGGLTGAACALSFATAGVKVLVLDAARVGGGTTARAAGFVREDADASFQETAAAHGLRAARLLWQSMRRASLDFSAALRRQQIRCDLTAADLLVLAGRHVDAVRQLRKEYQARRDAGLEYTWMTASALQRASAIDGAGGAIRVHGAVLDPYRACVGLIASAARRGALVFEGTDVTRIRAGRKQVEVATSRGRITARAVLVATAAPLPDLRALRRHLKPLHSYAVVTEPLPSMVRRELGTRTASLRDTATPPHFLRWLKDDRVLFTGADQPAVPDRMRQKVLVQRTGQLMYELSTLYPAISGARPEWAWDFEQYETVDELPYIGTHRNFPRHLFALGHGRHGLGVAWLAARLLLRAFHGAPAKGDELFGFARIL
jgi:glycine/D-amino acid oxidase-like deaminating enzyme